MSTFQHFTHKYFLSQILLLPGQPWPTLLLGHMGRHIHFSFFKIKNIFESRNWWPFKAGQLGVIHSFVWYYRGRGGLKLRLIRTSFTLGPSETQVRLNCLAFSLSNLLQHLASDQVGIYASRNISTKEVLVDLLISITGVWPNSYFNYLQIFYKHTFESF